MSNIENLHGTHYTEAQFDAEVDRLVEEWKREEGDDLMEADIRNAKIEFANRLYSQWNPYASEAEKTKFRMEYGSAALGYATFGNTKDDGANPLLQPIHGISLQDYAAASSKMANGVSIDAIVKALGVEMPIWDEASALWISRMQQDSTFTVISLMGTYFADAAKHPKLGSLTPGAAASSPAGQSNLEKLATDRYFYEELCGARTAAYQYGMDGAQWIQDIFGSTLGDFQSVAMQYMQQQNNNWNSNEIMHYHQYQEEKQKEYAAKFAAEQGGNVADDIEF
jgi:hypothetical protein